MNLKLGAIASAAGFVFSLLIGFFSGGALSVSLMRAVFFGMVFFILSNVIWMFINRFLPELLMPPEEEPLITGLEAGSRVNISIGDDEEPVNAAVPSEKDSGGELGNVAELAAEKARTVDALPAAPAPAASAAPAGDAGNPAKSPVLDLSAKEGYSRSGVLAASGEKKQSGAGSGPAEDSGAAFVPSPPPSPLQNSSGGDSGGGIETLPDLDAMAGAFMSSDEEEGEEMASPAPIFGAEPKPRASGKARSREDDYNPKEVASAIQTLLKRD
ncbi:MAG: hypothetical protein LBL70_04340 [Treponema sp.]|jgi:hypothetical protein|nr:hypothetical protein [Treponema sp.]